jgi:type IV secretion system protein VirD4
MSPALLPVDRHLTGIPAVLITAVLVLLVITGNAFAALGWLWDTSWNTRLWVGLLGSGSMLFVSFPLLMAWVIGVVVIAASPLYAYRYLQALFAPPALPRPDTTHGSARWATPDEIAGAGLAAPEGIPLHSLDLGNGVLVPLRYRGNRHLVTVAPSRSGKGATSIIPTLLEYPGSALVIDPKGQNAAVTARRREELGQRVLILNPFGVHGLPQSAFNPLSILDAGSPDLARDTAVLADALIVYGGHGDSHWTDSARELVQALLLDVVTDPAVPDSLRTLAEVRRRLTLPRSTLTKEFERMACSPLAGGLLAAKAGRFVDDSKEVGSIISTAVTQTAVLDFPQIQQAMARTDFDFAELKRTPTTVYLVLPADTLATCGRWLRLMISLALRAMGRTQGKPAWPVLFILDEFAALGHLEAIEQAAGLMAGFGVQLWPILQDLPQLKNLYRERWESFLANAGVIEFFRPNDLVTADYLSRRLGTMTQGTTSQSVSASETGGSARTSWSYGSTGRSLLQPDEVLQLDEAGAVLFVQGLPPIWASRAGYYETARYAGMFDPDPEHQAVASAAGS